MITPYDHSPFILTHYATTKNARMTAGILCLMTAIMPKHNGQQQEITSCP